MSDLKNRVAPVTGGSCGIGKAVALALAKVGAAVAVNYPVRAADAKAVVEAIQKDNGRAATSRPTSRFAAMCKPWSRRSKIGLAPSTF